jgi:hypothetical protein
MRYIYRYFKLSQAVELAEFKTRGPDSFMRESAMNRMKRDGYNGEPKSSQTEREPLRFEGPRDLKGFQEL